jgi:uncharacterized membrane protein (UPF0127 family)
MVQRFAGRVLAVAVGIGAFGSCGANGGAPTDPEPDDCPVVQGTTVMAVCIGDVVVYAELATTLAQRQQGLMNRPPLPDTAAMMFVFGRDQTLSFWMRNTPSPLSVAVLDSTRTILNIEDMEPNTDTDHRSVGLARYALEVRRGWFAARGIGPGAKATFTLPPGIRIDP